MADNIKVAIRVRQLIDKERQAGHKSNWTVEGNSIYCNDESVCGKKPAVYSFDHIFDDTAYTEDVFNEICKPILQASLNGFNGTIFAYGQSSSGKTHTITGSPSFPGIIPLAVDEIFHQIEQIPHKEFLIRVGYLEMYNEKLSDLLADRETTLKLQEDMERNIKIVGLSEEVISEKSKIPSLLKQGNAKRHTAETKQNDRSSRSHCILRFVIESRMIGEDEDKAVMVSNLYFVDLAGSEKAGENSGDRFREGCSINKSLFTLGNIIRKLSGDESAQHYTTRDSKLTRLLQNALGGNSKTAIICTVTPAHIDETESTLKFASRAKTIQNKAHVNEVLDDAALLVRYRKQIKSLMKQIKEGGDDELAKKLQEKEDTIEKLRNMILISGSGQVEEPALKKRRRETWAPGKIKGKSRLSLSHACNFNLAPLSVEDPIIEEEEEPAEMALTDDIMQDNIFSQPPVQNSVHDDTSLFNNEDLKQLYELQDAHEILKEELSKKQLELDSLKEFKELDLQIKDETIRELTDKINDQEKGTRWLEDEYMKAKQESNSLKHKLESLNRELKSVEDGTGLSVKCEQLTDAEKKIEELNSEIDIQKSRYEFHIEQMKKKVENLTNLLEQKGIDSDIIKQRLTSQTEANDEITDMKIAHEARVFELQNEIDMLVQSVEREQSKLRELDDKYNTVIEDQRNRFQKDIQDRDEEIEVYRGLLEEEVNKNKTTKPSNTTDSQSLREELEKLKEEHEESLKTLQSELEEYKKMSKEGHKIEENKGAEPLDLQTELLRSEIDRIKLSYEEEISEWRQKYEQILTEKNTGSNSLSNLQTEMLSAEVDSLKTMYEEEIKCLKEKNESLKKKIDKKNSTSHSTSEFDEQSARNEMKECYEGQVKELKLCLEEKEKLIKSHANLIESDEVNNAVSTEEFEKLKDEYEEKLRHQREELESVYVQLKDRYDGGTDLDSEIKGAEINEMKENYEKQIQELRSSLEANYENQLEEFKTSISNKHTSEEHVDPHSTEALIEEMKSVIDKNQGKISEYENLISELNNKITDLSDKLSKVNDKSESIHEVPEIVVNSSNTDESEKDKKMKANYESEILKYKERIVQLEEENDHLKSGSDGVTSDNRMEEIQNEMKRNKVEYESKLLKLQEYERLYTEHVQKSEQPLGKSLQDELLEVGTGLMEGCIGGKHNMMVSFDEDVDMSILERKPDKIVKKVQFREDTMEIDDDGTRTQSRLDQCADCKEKEQTFDMYETTLKETQEEVMLFRETIGELKEKIEQLDLRNKTLKQENLELINAKADQENLNQKLEEDPGQKNTTVIEEKEQFEREMSHLREQKEQEIQELKEKLVENSTNLQESVRMMNELQTEKDNLHEKLHSLADKQQTLQMYEEMIEELKQSIKEKEKSNIELQAKCDELEATLRKKESETDHNETQAILEKLSSENTLHAELIEEFKRSLEQAEKHKAELQAKCDALEAELKVEKEIKSSCDDVQTKLEKLTSENTLNAEEFKRSLEQAEKCNTELQVKCDELEAELKVERENKLDIDETNAKLERLVSENTFNTDLIEDLKKSLEHEEKLNIELQAKCEELEAELKVEKESKSDYDDIQAKLEELSSENTLNVELVEEFKRSLEHKEKYNVELQAKCEELEAMLKDEKDNSLDNDDIQAKLEKLTSENTLNADLIEEFKRSLEYKEKHNTELQAKCEELEALLKVEKENQLDIDETYAKLEKLTSENALNAEVIEEFKKSLEYEEKENTELQAKCVKLEAELTIKHDRESDYDIMQEKLERLTSENTLNAELIEEFKKSLEFEEKQNTELQAKCEELEAELKIRHDSKSDYDEMQAKLEKLTSENTVNAELIEEFKKSLEYEEKQNTELQAKCEELEAELKIRHDSKSDYDEMQAKLEKLSSENTFNAELIEELKKSLECEEKHNSELQTKCGELEALLQDEKENKSENDEKLEKLTSENTLNTDLIEDLKKTLEHEEKRNTELQAKCDKLDALLKVEKESESDYEKVKAKLEKVASENILNVELIDEYRKEVSEVKEKLALEEKFYSGELLSLKTEKESIEKTMRQNSLKYQSEIDELRRQIEAVSQENGQLKSADCEKISNLEKEKCELDKVIKDYEEEIQELKEKLLKYDEKKGKAQEESLNQNKTDQSEMEINTLKSKIESLEMENMHLTLYLPPGNLKYHTKPENVEWETKWEEFVKVEKRKRYVMASEIRNLRAQVKRAEENLKADAEDAIENIRLTDKIIRLEKELKALEAGKDALLAEKRTTDEKKKNSQTTSFISDDDHCCKFRQDLVNMKTEHFKIQQELESKKQDIDEMHERHQSQVSKLKNEIRRRNDLETTFEVGKMTQPNFMEEKSKELSAKTFDMWCGSSSSGGIVDHFKACIMEGENKRLKKELEKANKALASMRRGSEATNIKENLSQDVSSKSDTTKTEDSELIPTSGSSQRHALGEMATKAATPKIACEQSVPTSMHKKDDYKFDLSDLYQKKEEPDYFKKPADRKNLFEKEDQQNECKTS